MEFFSGFDLKTFITSIGYIGIFGIVFAESGLFIGFFLPGDSLLFTAGLLASQGFFHIGVLVVLCFIGAVLGDNFGYAFGKKVGPAIFTREDSLFFSKKNLHRARFFYETYGAKTIVLARFIPVIRTFAPILAGVGEMRYSVFFFYNIIGAAIWGVGLPFVGYYLGTAIPNIDTYMYPIVGLIIFLSFLPPIIDIWRYRRNQ